MAASNQFILLTFKSLHVLKKSVHGHRKAFKEHQPSAVCFSISVPWVPNHRQGMQVFQTQDSLARRRMLETLELWSCQVERSWSDACHLPETHTKKWYLENKICPVLVTAPAVINHPDKATYRSLLWLVGKVYSLVWRQGSRGEADITQVGSGASFPPCEAEITAPPSHPRFRRKRWMLECWFRWLSPS